MTQRAAFGTLVVILAVAACDKPPKPGTQERDLSLAPTEQIVTTFNDRAQIRPDPIGRLEYESEPDRTQTAATPQDEGRSAAATAQSEPEPQPESMGAPLMPEPLAEPPAPPSLGEDFVLDLSLADNIEVDARKIGEPVEATVRSAVFNSEGELVIPAGATFRGNIADVETSVGEVDLVFNTVEFNGEEREIEPVSATVATEADGGDEGYGSYGTGGGYGGILDTRGGPGSGITIIPVGSPVVCRVPNRGLIGRSNRFPFSRGIAVRR